MIAAGLDGVEKGMALAEPVEESLFEMDAARIAEKGIRELPGTLGEALDELERDEVIRDALGDHVFSHYVEAKRSEWDEYRTQVIRLGGRALPRRVLGKAPREAEPCHLRSSGPGCSSWRPWSGSCCAIYAYRLAPTYGRGAWPWAIAAHLLRARFALFALVLLPKRPAKPGHAEHREATASRAVRATAQALRRSSA